MLLSGLSFENLVQLLNESNTFYLVKIDLNGNYVYFNEHFTNRHASFYKPGEVKSAGTALLPEDQVKCSEVFVKCIENPSVCFPSNVKKLDGKGGYIMTFWEYKANRMPNGEVDGVVGIGYDITAFESHKEYIRFLTGKLNEAAHQQSHLVRRPLANIIGLVEVLKQFTEDDENLNSITTMLSKSCDELNDEFDAFLLRDFSGNNTSLQADER